MRQPTQILPRPAAPMTNEGVALMTVLVLPGEVESARRALAESEALVRLLPDVESAAVLGTVQAALSRLIRIVSTEVAA